MAFVEKGNVGDLGYYLGGGKRRGEAPPNGHITAGNRKAGINNSRAIASAYGIQVEQAAMEVWTGERRIPPVQAAQNLFFATIVRRQLVSGYKNLEPVFGHKKHEHNINEIVRKVYDTDALRGLLTTTNNIYGLDFSENYKRLPLVGGEVGPEVIHLVNTLLVLSRLTNYPRPPIAGIYHRDVKVPKDGVPAVKFDAIVTPRSRKKVEKRI